MISVYDDNWVDAMLALAKSKPPESNEIRPNSLWLSKATGRRGMLLWVSQGRCCLSYDESDLFARTELSVSDLYRLYSQVK